MEKYPRPMEKELVRQILSQQKGRPVSNEEVDALKKELSEKYRKAGAGTRLSYHDMRQLLKLEEQKKAIEGLGWFLKD